MNDETLEVDGLSLKRGTVTKSQLHVLELVDGSNLALPFAIFRGAKPGPIFYLGAAFHGDEVNGIEVVSKFAKGLDLNNLRGTVIVVPAQNPLALQVQHRYYVGHFMRSPLDQSPADPWVAFPGTGDGNMASQIARRLFEAFLQHAHYFLDIHTPTSGGRYAPFAFLPPHSAGGIVDECKKLAGFFGADFILSTDHGVYVQEESPHVVLARRDTVALGLEIGEGGMLDPYVTERGLRGLNNVFRSIGMINGKSEIFGEQTTIPDMTAVRSHRGGLLHRTVGLNEMVRSGQVVATITDLFGDVVEEIKAPHEGPVVRITTFPAVSAGERVVQLGG